MQLQKQLHRLRKLRLLTQLLLRLKKLLLLTQLLRQKKHRLSNSLSQEGRHSSEKQGACNRRIARLISCVTMSVIDPLRLFQFSEFTSLLVAVRKNTN